jgi:glutaredoxin-like YruB-family protein
MPVKTVKQEIKVYSTPTCPWCHKVKDYLKTKGVQFKDIDVSKDDKAAEEMFEKTGQLGVPVIIIGEKVIVGFDKDAIDIELMKT